MGYNDTINKCCIRISIPFIFSEKKKFPLLSGYNIGSR